MSGDYSRLTFRPERAYSAVRLQQGRVQLDADWNEEADIGLYRDRTTATDVIGRTGVPEAAPGFALTVANPDNTGSGTDILIGTGRAYVEGILVENASAPPTRLEPVGAQTPDLFRVVSGVRLRVDQWVQPAAGGAAIRVAELLAAVDADNGRQRVRLAPPPAQQPLDARVLASLRAQPFLLTPELPQAAGLHLAYLEVFERDLTALDEPALREVALGGPDTATRTQTVWRVRVLDVPDAQQNGPTTCKDFPPGWRPFEAASATLAARTQEAVGNDSPCLIPDAGGYRGIENHLYRVEVHHGGRIGTDPVTIKWSRDNASHRTRLLGVSNRRLQVQDVGRDAVTQLANGQWLEVQSEAQILAGEPGHFVRIGDPNGLELAVLELRDPVGGQPLVDVNGDPDVGALPNSGTVRRFEGGPPVAVQPGQAITLEAGIEIVAAAGQVQAGDFWTIPARALTGGLDWPRDPASGGPAGVLPQGVRRAFMALALIQRTAAGRLLVMSDCRPQFPPLTALTVFAYLGGDGQTAMPDLRAGNQATLVALTQPLRVGVLRGGHGVAGRLVRFATADQPTPGRLAPIPGWPAADVLRDTGTELVLRTGASGIAEARLSLHGQRQRYLVRADLLDASDPARGDPATAPINFAAATTIAADTAYDPSGCLYQRQTPNEQAPARTVQDAIDRLCPAIQLEPLGGDGQISRPAQPLPTPLRVGLLWGGRRMPGQRVEFRVTSNNATIAGNALAVVSTDDEGVAAAVVRAGDDPAANQGVITVQVTVPGLPMPTWPAALTFTAQFADGDARPGIRAGDLVRFDRGAQRPFRPGEVIAANDVAEGFIIGFDQPIDPECLKNWFIGEVWIDLPSPRVLVNDGRPAIGAYAFRPDGQFTGVNGENNAVTGVRWRFGDDERDWLQTQFTALLRSALRPTATARLVVHGTAVWSASEPRRWLDGDLFSMNAAGLVRRPVGDGREGGDLVVPFLIAAAAAGGGLRIVPFADAALFANIAELRLQAYRDGLDLAIDRQAIAAANVLPAGTPLRTNVVRNLQAATQSLSRAEMQRTLALGVPQTLGGAAELIMRSMRELQITARAIPLDTSTSEALIAQVANQRELDAVLVDEATERQLRAATALRRPLAPVLVLI